MNRIHFTSPILAVFTCLLAACSSNNDTSSATSTTASVTSSASTSGVGGGSTASSSTSGSTSTTGAGGGTGGTSGAGGGTGGATSGTSGTGGAGGKGGKGSCTVGAANACPSGQYCDAPDCKTGTCTLLGVDGGDESPVCGCDSVTYWNGTTAASHGMSVAKSGECAKGIACGGAGNVQCAAGQSCNIALADATACPAATTSGVCWGMPTNCPIGIGFGANLSTCDADPWCVDPCTIIQSGKPWFADDTCPL